MQTQRVISLAQGQISGTSESGIDKFHNIPYCGPHVRFQPPTPVSTEAEGALSDGTKFGSNCPQLYPTPLEILEGPPVYDTSLDDEVNCGVLSVYRPSRADANGHGASVPLPVIVWVHGGAWCVGGAQAAWYDGSRLARDGNAVCVGINYRLGVFGYLYEGPGQLAVAMQDVIAALQWVTENIAAFGGDPGNITAMGQSAGGYTVQLLLDLRPDLFHRAVIQSSPCDWVFTQQAAEKVQQDVLDSLPAGQSRNTASTQQLLAAQKAAQQGNKDMFVQFSPVLAAPPGGRNPAGPPKTILIGWTKDDGTCIGLLGHAAYGMPKWMREMIILELGRPVTREMFVKPALRLAERLAKHGHDIQTFCHTWAPEGFMLGAAHCVDLPLVLGDQAAWKDAPILAGTPWREWEARGKPYREALGRFARDGSRLPSMPGIDVDATEPF